MCITIRPVAGPPEDADLVCCRLILALEVCDCEQQFLQTAQHLISQLVVLRSVSVQLPQLC